jgi:hypothetical protein
MTTYRIRSWNTTFEKAQTRDVRQLSWIAVPNNFDGRGFKRLLRLPDGTALYGAWILLLEVASKCIPRGTLAKAGAPLSPADLALITGGDENLFERAVTALSAPEIGWLEKIETTEALPARSQNAPSTPQHVAATGQDITEQTTTPRATAARAVTVDDLVFQFLRSSDGLGLTKAEADRAGAMLYKHGAPGWTPFKLAALWFCADHRSEYPKLGTVTVLCRFPRCLRSAMQPTHCCGYRWGRGRENGDCPRYPGIAPVSRYRPVSPSPVSPRYRERQQP